MNATTETFVMRVATMFQDDTIPLHHDKNGSIKLTIPTSDFERDFLTPQMKIGWKTFRNYLAEMGFKIVQQSIPKIWNYQGARDTHPFLEKVKKKPAAPAPALTPAPASACQKDDTFLLRNSGWKVKKKPGKLSNGTTWFTSPDGLYTCRSAKQAFKYLEAEENLDDDIEDSANAAEMLAKLKLEKVKKKSAPAVLETKTNDVVTSVSTISSKVSINDQLSRFNHSMQLGTSKLLEKIRNSTSKNEEENLSTIDKYVENLSKKEIQDVVVDLYNVTGHIHAIVKKLATECNDYKKQIKQLKLQGELSCFVEPKIECRKILLEHHAYAHNIFKETSRYHLRVKQLQEMTEATAAAMTEAKNMQSDILKRKEECMKEKADFEKEQADFKQMVKKRKRDIDSKEHVIGEKEAAVRKKLKTLRSQLKKKKASEILLGR